VLTVLTAPVEFLAGETVAALFWPAVQFLAVIFAVVVLSMAGRAASDEEAAESDDATTGRQ
jgi:hypothetical protein